MCSEFAPMPPGGTAVSPDTGPGWGGTALQVPPGRGPRGVAFAPAVRGYPGGIADMAGNQDEYDADLSFDDDELWEPAAPGEQADVAEQADGADPGAAAGEHGDAPAQAGPVTAGAKLTAAGPATAGRTGTTPGRAAGRTGTTPGRAAGARPGFRVAAVGRRVAGGGHRLDAARDGRAAPRCRVRGRRRSAHRADPGSHRGRVCPPRQDPGQGRAPLGRHRRRGGSRARGRGEQGGGGGRRTDGC